MEPTDRNGGIWKVLKGLRKDNAIERREGPIQTCEVAGYRHTGSVGPQVEYVAAPDTAVPESSCVDGVTHLEHTAVDRQAMTIEKPFNVMSVNGQTTVVSTRRAEGFGPEQARKASPPRSPPFRDGCSVRHGWRPVAA